MIWFTWRQFRIQLLVAAGVLVALSAALAIVRHNVADMYGANGLATCQSNCDSQISSFLNQVASSGASAVFYAGVAALYLTPALIGAFWGAPLLARELETGTYRLAWSQSVTRTRWLLIKLCVLGGASLAVTGLLSLAVTWSAGLIDRANDNRLGPMLFGARGLVPLGYAAFAFALGVTLGLVIRRTIPAMAATLGIYLVAVGAMPLWLRQFLAPIRHATPLLDPENISGLTIRSDGQLKVIGNHPIPGAWIISNDTIDTSGHAYSGPTDPAYCGGDASPKKCLDWIGTLHLRQSIAYHSSDQYWSLQWAETGVFLALSVVLAGFSLWWVRRRSV